MPRLHFIADDFLNQEDLCTEMLVGKTVAGGGRIIISRAHLEDTWLISHLLAFGWWFVSRFFGERKGCHALCLTRWVCLRFEYEKCSPPPGISLQYVLGTLITISMDTQPTFGEKPSSAEIAQSTRCLLNKQRNLSSISRTHCKNRVQCFVCV